jgi:crotonobetainyl-CoA:carnitine CoA-transferase CaiB-like acyl-CoA transferase
MAHDVNDGPAIAARSSDQGSAVLLMLDEIWRSLGGLSGYASAVAFDGDGALPSAFSVSDLAAAAIGAAGLAAAELVEARAGGGLGEVRVDRRLASYWFGMSLRPEGWQLAPAWDAIAGDYETKDGWIKLHTNAPHHRAAALAVLGVRADRESVAGAVRRWSGEALEAAVVERGGCAAVMRSLSEWAAHPQGASVAREPLIIWEESDAGPTPRSALGTEPGPERPLHGVRVLDLTRILAGPVATRFLAGLGAEVLRIDPPGWEEPSLEPEVTLGKRCARLDLRALEGRARLRALLKQADVLVHGYRPDALENLGLGAAERRRIRPGLVDVSLSAYGWSGPWALRRGFDSLVQMSSGIAHEGGRAGGSPRPRPLPVQALDHATGYLMAAAALRGLSERRRRGVGARVRLSLARTAGLLIEAPRAEPGVLLDKPNPDDFSAALERTSWGWGRRLKPPVSVAGCKLLWEHGAVALGSQDEACWRSLPNSPG